MNRREFLTLTAGAAAGSVARTDAQSTPGAGNPDLEFIHPRTGEGPYRDIHRKRPPNIFLITADMVSPDFYLPSRPLSRQIHLPALHALMDGGVFFSNAFCTVPLCAPSRASYLTGRYSTILGNGERAPEGLESELRPTETIFPEYLRAAGFATGHSGKSHVGTRKFLDAFGENDHPWNRWSPPIFEDDGYLDYRRRLGVKPQKYSREIVFLDQDRKTPGNSAGGWIIQQDGRPFPLEAQYSYYLMQRACDEIMDMAGSPATKNKPIYYQLDLFDPHQPLSVPSGFEDRESDLRRVLQLPQTYERVRAENWARIPDQPEIYDVYRRYWGLYDRAAITEYRLAYALQMELVDKVIGIFLAKLKSLGLYDDSLIVFMSDHGEMNGRWAIIDKGPFLYPDVLRTPLVIKPPAAGKIGSHEVSAPVSLMDVGPTILSFAGLEPEVNFDGRSLLPYLERTAVPGDRDLLFFGGWHVAPNFACGIQQWRPDGSHYLYAYNCSSPVDELYDLNAVDAVNLAGSTQHDAVRRDMIRRLGAALQRDPRWTGYWAEYRIAKYFDLPKSGGDMQIVSGAS